MKPVCRHIRLQGLGAEKQLTYLQQQGYTLYDIKRINLRTIEFGFLQKESASILTYLTERGFTCDPLPIRGTARKLQSLINQTPLLCFILFVYKPRAIESDDRCGKNKCERLSAGLNIIEIARCQKYDPFVLCRCDVVNKNCQSHEYQEGK